MVEKNISREAIKNKHTYLYKDKIEILPLIMQDDVLTITKCGKDSKTMNTFLNTRSRIMGLQFGAEKCEKMHIGKYENKLICCDLEVDKWKTIKEKNKHGKIELKDQYNKIVNMKELKLKKYLGTIISDDLKNEANIIEKSNKDVGSVNKIINIINEGPFGKYSYKAAAMLRESLLLGTMLSNAETWTSLTDKDTKKLEKMDNMLQRKLVSENKNALKAFMAL